LEKHLENKMCEKLRFSEDKKQKKIS